MPTAINVLVLDAYAEKYAHTLRQQFSGITMFPTARLDALAIDLADVDVLIAFGIAINDDLVRRAARLKWIQSLATGVDHFLRCSSLRPQTVLTSARGIHGPAVRETVLFMMLALSHDASRLLRNQAEHRWDRSKPRPLIARKTAVVMGTGVSGSAVGAALQALGMQVIGLSRTPRVEPGFDRIVALDTLRETVRSADYLINIMPGGPANTNLIGTDVFAAMKPSAFFINVGRGENLDEAALIETLRDKRIAGAALDVFANEPLPPDSPLWDLPNVIITSHITGLFDEYEDYVLPLIIENMRHFLAGEPEKMRNVVPH
jgi:phosphoglycerate dehydrogenase-like enzyme